MHWKGWGHSLPLLGEGREEEGRKEASLFLLSLFTSYYILSLVFPPPLGRLRNHSLPANKYSLLEF